MPLTTEPQPERVPVGGHDEDAGPASNFSQVDNLPGVKAIKLVFFFFRVLLSWVSSGLTRKCQTRLKRFAREKNSSLYCKNITIIRITIASKGTISGITYDRHSDN